MITTVALSLVLSAGLAGGPGCSGSSSTTASNHYSMTNASWSADKNIVETAVAAGSFKTLAAALEAAGLLEALQGSGPFTVFAPTDEAFAALGTTVQDLLKPENKAKLASILTYHVVAGRVFAEQAKGLTEAKTVNGQTVAIESMSGKLKVGGATVVAADIDASNGVIHVIDTVLLPK